MCRLSIAFLLTIASAGACLAQTPPPAQPQPTSPFYPAPPPLQAPKVEKGTPTTGLSSPLAGSEQAPTRTTIEADAEAQLFATANRMVWGRYAKMKGAKPGDIVVAKQNGLWTVKGRLDSLAAGTEGDWVTIDAVVERISAGLVQIRGEVAFRVAKVEKGAACKVAGAMHLRRSGRSQIWRLQEGDNPCDGTQEFFDLIADRPAPAKPPPPRRG